MTTNALQKITLEVVKPLCPQTERMFSPIQLNSSDRIRIRQAKDLKQFTIEFYAITQDGEYVRGSYNARVRFATRLPDRQKLTDSKWKIGATDINVLLIAYHWDRKHIVFEDALSRVNYEYLVANFVKQTEQVKKRTILNGFTYRDSPHFPLAPYQQKALKACLGMEGFGLFMEQGTGKTAIAIARICNEALRKPDKLFRALIICPNAVRENWANEIKKFASVKCETSILDGTEINRVKAIIGPMKRARLDPDCKAFIAIISTDSVGNSEAAMGMVPWDIAIIDESHGIRNASTKRWKAMEKLRGNCHARMILTGTPIANSMMDLWTQFEFMGEGWSGFTTFPKFKQFYGVFAENAAQDQSGYQRLVGLTNVPMIQERLARQAFLIKKSEALPDLPEKMYDIHSIKMTRDQESAYNQLCQTLMAEFEDALADSTEKDILVVNNILTQMLRLAQITSGFVGIPERRDEDGNIVQEPKINRFDPNPKVEACVEILKEKNDKQKTIIWTDYVQNIKTLKARLDLEGISAVTYYGATSKKDREEAVRRFNEDPTCKVFIGNPRAGGVGINLLGYPIGGKADTYCDHVIYYSQNWSAIDRSQSEDRAHRRGTVCHVRYTDLVVPGTIDEEIRDRVLDKRMSALKIQDIKGVISRIMKG